MPLSSLITRWRKQPAPASPASGAAAPAAPSPEAADRFTYPAVDPGIVVHGTDMLLAANADVIGRIKLAYGCDNDSFERDIMRPVRGLARYVSVLPATHDNYFSQPGGLLRMALEIGFYALQATDAQIFEGRATISSRVLIEPRWRLATFLAGLCGELHRTLGQVTVRDEHGQQWPAYLHGLEHWLAVRKATRIYPRWNDGLQETRANGLFALPHIVESDALQHLATGNAIVVPHMLASICGMATYREVNILEELVKRSTVVVIDTDLRATADRFGSAARGGHIERYLIDAMRRLIVTNASWQLNQHHGRVWYGEDGLYLVWPKALAEVAALLEADHLPGIPKSPDTLLEILIEDGFACPFSDQRSTWTILPPDATVAYEALKLTEPAVLLASIHPAPMPLPVNLAASARLAVARGPAAASATSASQVRPRPAAARGAPPAQAAQRQAPAGTCPASPPEPEPAEGSLDFGPPDLVPQYEVYSEEGATSVPGADSAPAPARFSLRPTLRLREAQAKPLRVVVDQLNTPRQHVCRTVPEGLFIPLNELAQRSIQLRELASAGLLVCSGAEDNPYHHHHEFDGSIMAGVVIAPQFIAGLGDVGDEPAGATDAVT